MTALVSIWLVLLLGLTAGLKAWRADQAAGALATYGIQSPQAQHAGLWTLVSIELLLAGALALGLPWAAGAIAALFLAFALITSAALLAGRKGRPCACFGSASRLGWAAPTRAGALALVAGAIALGWLPNAPFGYDRWLTLGLSACVVGVLALAVTVLALAREVGVLRLGAAGRGALEIPQEGPPVGSRQPWAPTLQANPRALLALAVFTSDGCPLCRQVEPAVAHVAGDPLLAVRIFDEATDSQTWSEAEVPGSPYAVALSLDGVVLAKGTFNSLGQLESILGTARVRERELPLAA